MCKITAQTVPEAEGDRLTPNCQPACCASRGSLEGSAPWAWKFQCGTWKEILGISAQCPNLHAEHKGNLCKSKTSCSIKEEPRAETESWGGVLEECGPHPLSSQSQGGLSYPGADSLPKQLCACSGWQASGRRCGAGEGALVVDLGHASAFCTSWQRSFCSLDTCVFPTPSPVSSGPGPLRHPCCCSQRLKDKLWDM